MAYQIVMSWKDGEKNNNKKFTKFYFFRKIYAITYRSPLDLEIETLLQIELMS